MSSSFSLADWQQSRRQQVEHVLDKQLTADMEPRANRLLAAMRYATLGGGKRLRALLVYATGEAFNGQPEQLDPAAAAVEFMHAYSLVHDDMPAMDNDDLRRGRPTCHKAYDEATAMLTGDALQTEAFACCCDSALSDTQQARLVKVLAHSAGVNGMAGGQAIDLEAVGQLLDVAALQQMHQLKTGALIQASVQMGAIAANQTDPVVLQALDDYARAIGLAFQVQDDVLDVTTDTVTLGKTQGADMALDKPTYPSLLGLDEARRKAADLIDSGLQALQSVPFETTALAALAQFVIRRAH